MVSQRSGVGVCLSVGLLLLVLILMSTNIVGVHCLLGTGPLKAATASTQQPQNILLFHQYEDYALNTILQNWTKLNPQSRAQFTLLNWSPDQHPCNRSDFQYIAPGVEYEGAWRGVSCTQVIQNSNATGIYHQASVTGITLYGSNSSCGLDYDYDQCGFEGIIGQLPSEIGKLINLQSLNINNNPELTGPVPIEIWQMPNLITLHLQNNSLVGTLPSNVDTSSKLVTISLAYNNFSGSLQVSPQGTLFSSSLTVLQVSYNQLDGPVDFQGLNASRSISGLYLSNNRFNGTFYPGQYFNPSSLSLSNNGFTSIRFTNYTGYCTTLCTKYMPILQYLYVDNNKFSGPFPTEILQMPSLTQLDLSGNNFSGSVDFTASDKSWITGFEIINLSNNNFSGLVDFRGPIDTTSSLQTLNISNNNFNETFFSGPYLNPLELDLSNNHFNNLIFDNYNGSMAHIDDDYMPTLETLYIQNNNLNGTFPAHILKAPSLKLLDGGQNQYMTLQLPDISFGNTSLLTVYLTNNSLQALQFPNNPGPFSTSNLQVSNLLFLGGNPICNKIESVLLSTICRQNQFSPILNIIFKSDVKTKVIIATSTSGAFTLVILVTGIYVWRLMNRIKSLNIILGEFEKNEVKPNLYSYKEIKLATKNFDKNNKLGEGGFGIVYKGELFDGTMVAVKKLMITSSQVLSEFLNEVVIISGLKHRNLVKLKGCCLGDGEQRMLVFEYVENKNLAEALWMRDDSQNNIEIPYLDWKTRLNIILGIARGLAYLHEDLQSPVIHRDIKANNILLDKNYEPKIADFGLAYLYPNLDDEASHMTLMQVAGTRGYCSPEYALHGHISTALDVYSFGILILEILSGRKSIDLQKSGEEVALREWAWKQYKENKLMTLIDSKMVHFPTDLEAIMRAISLALACVHYKAAMRPKMNDVVSMLIGTMPIKDFSINFGHGEEASISFTIYEATSTSLEKENFKVDECCLLNNTCDIEMSRTI